MIRVFSRLCTEKLPSWHNGDPKGSHGWNSGQWLASKTCCPQCYSSNSTLFYGGLFLDTQKFRMDGENTCSPPVNAQCVVTEDKSGRETCPACPTGKRQNSWGVAESICGGDTETHRDKQIETEGREREIETARTHVQGMLVSSHLLIVIRATWHTHGKKVTGSSCGSILGGYLAKCGTDSPLTCLPTSLS